MDSFQVQLHYLHEIETALMVIQSLSIVLFCLVE